MHALLRDDAVAFFDARARETLFQDGGIFWQHFPPFTNLVFLPTKRQTLAWESVGGWERNEQKYDESKTAKHKKSVWFFFIIIWSDLNLDWVKLQTLMQT